MTEDPRKAAVKRLKGDYRLYASKCLKIRTKDAKIAPLILNQAQEILHEAIEKQIAELGFVRIIVLKGRQQGLSTYINGRLYHKTSMEGAQKTIVVAHKAESTSAIFDMTKRYHQGVPDVIRSSTKYQSKRELSFDKLDSSYLVVTAGGDDIARGETLQNAHLSEVAFWPKGTASSNFNGLMKAIPPRPGSMVFIESTANGVSGVFADMWRGAVDGKNGFLAVFIPWFVQDEYRRAVPDGWKRTPEEEDLAALYGLDDEQLAWRRVEVSQSGRDLFKQEYPSCPEEAFLTTGSPVFNTEMLVRMRASQVSSDFTRHGHTPGIGFAENPRGDLFVWHPPYPGKSYTIGADVAMGYRGGDYSVAVVLDDDRRVVARYRAHVNPEYFAAILDSLGRWFNKARIIVESNSHGILTCKTLAQELSYPNFYTEETVDKLTTKVLTKLGFATTAKTKPLIIDELRTAVSLDEMVIPDRLIINEMLTYVVDENGRMAAESGKDADGEALHDDTVMALALANHIHEARWEPVKVTEDFYFKAP